MVYRSTSRVLRGGDNHGITGVDTFRRSSSQIVRDLPERYARFLVRFFSIASEAKDFLIAWGSTRRPPVAKTHGFPAAT
jgi:hypothetical protein